jgi:hypothetical protein
MENFGGYFNGALSKLYANFPDATAKHAVAREFGLKHHKF